MKKFSVLFTLFVIFIPKFLFSYSLSVKGLNKININDIQSITSVDINEKNLSLDEINIIINELYNSDLIFDIRKIVNDDEYIIEIIENNLIENIYINGNIQIKDDDIINNLFSKQNTFMKSSNIEKYINIVESLYSSIGYDNSFVNVKTEKFSSNRINLIYQINEGKKSQQ